MISAVFLGIVQGLTEFLPISSSAHLILVPWLLGWDPSGLVFDVALHVGTALSILFYFWRDWVDLARELLRSLAERDLMGNEQRKMAWFLVVGTIPSGVFGLTMGDYIEENLRSPIVPAVMLALFAMVLLSADRNSRQSRSLSNLTWADSFWIGASQALALVPGVSRSGVTISTAMIRNVNRSAAARFSFLLSTPVIVGAGALEGWRLVQAILQTGTVSGAGPGPGIIDWGILFAGLISASITGFFCIRFFLKYLQTHTFLPFVIYRVALAAVIVGLYWRTV